MKYVKYLLLATLVVFGIKSIEAISYVGGNKIITEESYKSDEIDNINIDVNNANIEIIKSEGDEIQVISEITKYQSSKFKYSIGVNNNNKTLDVSVFTLDNFIEEINSYGKITIRIPDNKEIKTSNINIESGILEYSVNSEKLNVTTNSCKTKLSGMIDELNIKQGVGTLNIDELSSEKINASLDKGVLSVESVYSKDMEISGSRLVKLDIYRSFSNNLNLVGEYTYVKFNDIDDANVEVVNATIKKTNLKFSEGKYQHISEGDEKGSMTVNANNIVIAEFYIKGV